MVDFYLFNSVSIILLYDRLHDVGAVMLAMTKMGCLLAMN